MSRYQDVTKAFAAAKKRFDGYYSQSAYFAGAFSRALLEQSGWPRELVAWERPGHGPVAHVEDALVLDADTFWHLGLHLRIQEAGGPGDNVRVLIRFKRSGTGYIMELFHGVELDVQEPTPEGFRSVVAALMEEIASFYDRGLDLFLDGRASKLRLPFKPPVPRPVPAGPKE